MENQKEEQQNKVEGKIQVEKPKEKISNEEFSKIVQEGINKDIREKQFKELDEIIEKTKKSGRYMILAAMAFGDTLQFYKTTCIFPKGDRAHALDKLAELVQKDIEQNP